MTDALANWFLQSYEHGESPWLQLDVLTDNLTFEGFISKERSKKTIRNDDICLLVIEFGDYAVNE
jgi:hypothetical protein